MAGMRHPIDPEAWRKLWSREEYHRLASLGMLGEQRSELIEGTVYLLSTRGADHFFLVDNIARVLRDCFGDGVWVRTQGPLALGQLSEPEPDVSVVLGSPLDFRFEHPSKALLVVEVSLTSLRLDQTKKARMYAKGGVLDYWVVDLASGQLEVRREPGRVDSVTGRPTRFGYRSVATLGRSDFVSPLARPDIKLLVSELFGDGPTRD